MKKLLSLIAAIVLLGTSTYAHAAAWNESIDTAIKNGNYNQINIIAASNPDAQGNIALYLLQRARTFKDNPQKQAKVFGAATPFIGRIASTNAGIAAEDISGILKLAADKKFQETNPHEAADIFLYALNMSGQPNIVADDPNLHAEVLEAADDFVKEHPEDADKKLLEQVSLAQAGGAPETAPAGVINPSAE